MTCTLKKLGKGLHKTSLHVHYGPATTSYRFFNRLQPNRCIQLFVSKPRRDCPSLQYNMLYKDRIIYDRLYGDRSKYSRLSYDTSICCSRLEKYLTGHLC
jgi:hypothetical protein